MPFAPHSLKFDLSGTINGVQSWSTGFWASYGQGSVAFPSADAMRDALVGSAALDGYWNTFLGTISDLTSVSTRFTQLKYTVYGEGADNPSVGVRQAALAPINGSGAMTLPPEVAVVSSLRTGKVGASYRGRMYWPLLSAPVDSVGQLSAANATEVANAVAALFSSISGHGFDTGASGDANNTDVTPCVFSAKLGVLTPVSSIAVDERFDSQRRREDKLPGAIHTAAVSG